MFYTENQVSRKITSAFTSGKSSKHQSDKEKTLSKLFQAPTDIMTQTSFEEVYINMLHIILYTYYVYCKTYYKINYTGILTGI